MKPPMIRGVCFCSGVQEAGPPRSIRSPGAGIGSGHEATSVRVQPQGQGHQKSTKHVEICTEMSYSRGGQL